MKKQFYMLYAEGENSPTFKHESFESAKTEAERLAILLNKEIFVLKAGISIKPSPKTISTKLEELIGEDELPF